MTTITVYAGWRSPDHDIVLGIEVGVRLAEAGFDVAFGGGDGGAMGAVGTAAHNGGAFVTSITLPEWVKPVDRTFGRLITVPTLTERMGKLEEIADAFLILPGGRGTDTEFRSAHADRCNGAHSKPIVVCDPDDFFAYLWEHDRRQVSHGYAPADPLPVCRYPADAIAALDRMLSSKLSDPPRRVELTEPSQGRPRDHDRRRSVRPGSAPGAGRHRRGCGDPRGPVRAARPGHRSGTLWTRVTTAAKTISDTFTLNRWGRRMAVKGLTMREDLYVLAAATPLEDRDTLNDIADQAIDFAGAKVGASLGISLHAFTEQHDRGQEVTAPVKYRPHVAAYAAALAEHGLEVVPEYIERIVLVRKYAVAGRLDRIFRVTRDVLFELPGMAPFVLTAGTLILGDLKTGRDLSYGWLEIAVQLALYGNADLLWNRESEEYEPMPELDTRVAIVVHLPARQDDASCEMFDVNLAQGWSAAKLCFEVRAARRNSGGLAVPRLVTRASIASSGESVVEVEDPAGWSTLIETARTESDLGRIWQQIAAAGQTTSRLGELWTARRATITADTKGT